MYNIVVIQKKECCQTSGPQLNWALKGGYIPMQIHVRGELQDHMYSLERVVLLLLKGTLCSCCF